MVESRMIAEKESRNVCISGIGARTPVGPTAFATASAVRAAVSMLNEHPYMIDKAGNPMVVARDAFLSNAVGGVDRFVEIGLPAAEEALAPLAKISGKTLTIDILVGLPLERPGLPKGLSEKIVVGIEKALFQKQKRFSIGAVEPFQNGHSAGLIALQKGWQQILNGDAAVCLVGGVDSYLTPETLEWLDENDHLNAETNTWGFIPGEAAGFCLLCASKIVKDYKLPNFGNVVTATTAHERNLINTDSVCLGEGLSEAVKSALEVLPSSIKVDYTICDMNGEPYRADEFGYTIVRTGERFIDPTDFMTPADCWGDVGAASGPLSVVYAIVAGLKGYSRGPYTLIFTSSDSGERTVVLLHTGEHS